MRSPILTAAKAAPFLFIALLAACAPANVNDLATAHQSDATRAVDPPEPDHALIVFMRASAGVARDAAVFDVTDGEPVFIAAMTRLSKFAHYAKAGKRRFMVVGASNADFLDATFDGGKVYYSLVAPSWGDRYWFRAYRTRGPYDKSNLEADTSRFRTLYDQSNWIENIPTPRDAERVDEYMASVRAMMTRWLPRWEQRPDKPMLVPADGRPGVLP